MDVIALRKTTGTISGDVRLNGYPQDPVAFRRCSGYVEQFDVRTRELTVRETVLFSARLRLDDTKVESDADKQEFVDEVLSTLELTPLADVLIGCTETGGLSFEQKKRLSIAVELAASPSILFLDEVRCSFKLLDKIQPLCPHPSVLCFEAYNRIRCEKRHVGRQTASKDRGPGTHDLCDNSSAIFGCI